MSYNLAWTHCLWYNLRGRRLSYTMGKEKGEDFSSPLSYLAIVIESFCLTILHFWDTAIFFRIGKTISSSRLMTLSLSSIVFLFFSLFGAFTSSGSFRDVTSMWSEARGLLSYSFEPWKGMHTRTNDGDGLRVNKLIINVSLDLSQDPESLNAWFTICSTCLGVSLVVMLSY